MRERNLSITASVPDPENEAGTADETSSPKGTSSVKEAVWRTAY
jgi:hypothetical protein